MRTVVVLPAGFDGVLPVAALPALRAATRVLRDASVPPATAAAAGAEDGEPVGIEGVVAHGGVLHPRLPLRRGEDAGSVECIHVSLLLYAT